MKPLISEFSYGFALTEELIHWYGTSLTAAPVFPSLFSEGQSGGGYDVRLDRPGIPLFLQFKLSDCMTRNNASEVIDGLLNVDYYRMHLRRKSLSNQHQMLVDLEARGNEVFYAAPAFHQPQELNTAWMNHRVREESLLLAPSRIGPLQDDDEHHIAFKRNGTSYNCFFRSESSTPPLGPIRISDFPNRILRKIKSTGKTALTDNYLQSLRQIIFGLVETSRKVSDFALAPLQDLRLEQQIAHLSRTFLNCQFLVVHEKET